MLWGLCVCEGGHGGGGSGDGVVSTCTQEKIFHKLYLPLAFAGWFLTTTFPCEISHFLSPFPLGTYFFFLWQILYF